jgi:hypothetical protein
MSKDALTSLDVEAARIPRSGAWAPTLTKAATDRQTRNGELQPNRRSNFSRPSRARRRVIVFYGQTSTEGAIRLSSSWKTTSTTGTSQ